jgi:hypothetical protein
MTVRETDAIARSRARTRDRNEEKYGKAGIVANDGVRDLSSATQGVVL